MPIQLDPEQAIVMVVDMQDRLLPAIHEREAVVRRAEILIKAARILGIPIIWTEQYRKGLGETDPTIRQAIGSAAEAMEKRSFGCFGDEDIAAALIQSGRRQIVLCGIETHVCILQTALKALEKGWDVLLAEDAVGSRRPADREAALRRLAQAGAVPATVEMVIMECLRVAGGDHFKAILPLLKE
ncbi:MAG: hydrolase [bacterium]|nr:hydrolase [bacterium]